MPGIRGTLHEYKEGTLHSGSKGGPVVKSRAQAIAIGLSEERSGKRPGQNKMKSNAKHTKIGARPS